MNTELKAAVTVAEMARMIGMSRSRLYQLMGSAFPEPSRDDSGRPYFDEEQQQTILEVRRRNCGIDGKPILFYAPRKSFPLRTPKRMTKPKPAVPTPNHPEVVQAIQALGLSTTASQVEKVIKDSFPNGVDGIDIGEVVRSVFLSIQCQDSTNKPSE